MEMQEKTALRMLIFESRKLFSYTLSSNILHFGCTFSAFKVRFSAFCVLHSRENGPSRPSCRWRYWGVLDSLFNLDSPMHTDF